MRHFRIFLGAVIWGGIVAALVASYRGAVQQDDGKSKAVNELVDFATAEETFATLEANRSLWMEVGDPIFLPDGPGGKLRKIGELKAVHNSKGEPVRKHHARVAKAVFYASLSVPSDAELHYYDRGRKAEWVLETMLPPEKTEQIAAIIRETYERHHQEILQALLPLVQESLRDASLVVERDLPKALVRHEKAIEALGRKYQQDIVAEKIAPLVKKEIWPIVQKHATPVADQVGMELWNKLPKGGLLWAMTKDWGTWSDYTRSRKRFRKYLKEEAVPALEKHSGDFVEVVQKIMKDTAKNDEVRRVLRESVTQMVKDPELQRIVWEIVKEVIIENPSLQQALVAKWTGEEAKAALSVALRKVDPAFNEIGHLLFGHRDRGFTPEFEEVLRSRILRKDRQFFVLQLPKSRFVASQPTNPTNPTDLILKVRSGGPLEDDPFLNSVAQAAD